MIAPRRAVPVEEQIVRKILSGATMEKGQIVISRHNGRLDIGETTGHTRRCHMEGCLGTRVRVKWLDGSHTYPCTRGMTQQKHWEIK